MSYFGRGGSIFIFKILGVGYCIYVDWRKGSGQAIQVYCKVRQRWGFVCYFNYIVVNWWEVVGDC